MFATFNTFFDVRVKLESPKSMCRFWQTEKVHPINDISSLGTELPKRQALSLQAPLIWIHNRVHYAKGHTEPVRLSSAVFLQHMTEYNIVRRKILTGLTAFG